MDTPKSAQTGAPGKIRNAAVLAALGVVFGDIGTSPLYTFETALNAMPGSPGEGAIAVASLILWGLILIVSIKYVGVVMRADYHGEGGVFALLAQLSKKRPVLPVLRLPAYVVMLLFGAALLYGDGTITPAISVLSALEGLEAIDPSLKNAVIPVTVAVLAILFSLQGFGTGNLARFFGPVMLLWFSLIGVIGLSWVVQVPEVLVALNPLFAIEGLRHAGWGAMGVMSGAVLAITGVEALYADMGHFGRRPIVRAWTFVAFPALALNYLGQAALAIKNPRGFSSGLPFFDMVADGWQTVTLVVFATAATIIASQALITGVFSLTAQARELGFLPKLRVIHTSRDERGQVFVPFANFALGATCILLVLTFRTSEHLAAAYGLAVVGTMVITTAAATMVTRVCWHWPLAGSLAFASILCTFEIPLLIASLSKIPEGGFFPLLVAALFVIVMLTWHRGRAVITASIETNPPSPEEVVGIMKECPALPGQLVIVTFQSRPNHAVTRLQEMLRKGIRPREITVILSLLNAQQSHVDSHSSVTVNRIIDTLWHVSAHHGYLQEPHAPAIINQAAALCPDGPSPCDEETLFVLPRELIIEYEGRSLARWRRSVFGVLSRNQSYAPDYLFIPHRQILEFTWMIRA
ncbi:MAG: KUP/HAK/KT family potassium transporter [Terrimicrobiaceae bacterium]